MKPRYIILGILGYSLRNKIPIVGNQGEGEMGSMEGWKRKPPSTLCRWGAEKRDIEMSESALLTHGLTDANPMPRKSPH